MNNPEWADRVVPEPDARPEYPVDGVYEQRPVRLARRTIVDRLVRRPARPYTAWTLRRDVASELQAWDFLGWGPYSQMPRGWPGRHEVEVVLSELRGVMSATNRMAPDDAELIDQVGGLLEDLRSRRPHAVVAFAKVCLDRIAGVR
jgi:hypothetical protein